MEGSLGPRVSWVLEILVGWSWEGLVCCRINDLFTHLYQKWDRVNGCKGEVLDCRHMEDTRLLLIMSRTGAHNLPSLSCGPRRLGEPCRLVAWWPLGEGRATLGPICDSQTLNSKSDICNYEPLAVQGCQLGKHLSPKILHWGVLRWGWWSASLFLYAYMTAVFMAHFLLLSLGQYLQV